MHGGQTFPCEKTNGRDAAGVHWVAIWAADAGWDDNRLQQLHAVVLGIGRRSGYDMDGGSDYFRESEESRLCDYLALARALEASKPELGRSLGPILRHLEELARAWFPVVRRPEFHRRVEEMLSFLDIQNARCSDLVPCP